MSRANAAPRDTHAWLGSTLSFRNLNAHSGPSGDNHDQVTVFDPRRIHIAEGMIELANELTEAKEIAFAFPNFVSEYRRMGVTPFHPEQWHLKMVEARKAWKHTRGQRGVDAEHPNLRDNIRKRPDRDERRDLCGRDFLSTNGS
jgi:hypothetical protein